MTANKTEYFSIVFSVSIISVPKAVVKGKFEI